MKKSEFTRRVLARQDMLYRICCGMLRDPQDRMDAVQETILRAWENVDRLRDDCYFETWLTRILINVCHAMQRRAVSIPAEHIAEPISNDRTDSALRDALLAIDEDLRLPVLLHYMEGYKLYEVADILKLPEGTVKTRLARARMELRGLLKEDAI